MFSVDRCTKEKYSSFSVSQLDVHNLDFTCIVLFF